MGLFYNSENRLHKYLDVPVSFAPEWMNNLHGFKHVKYAEIEATRFDFVFYTLLTGRARCEFAILFYTEFNVMGRATFVAMDKTNGRLYLVRYWEDCTEPTYAIESSELLDEQRFAQLVENFNLKIPGIKTTYGDFYRKNWKEFLDIPQRQVINHFYLAIRFKRNEQQYFLHFIHGTRLPVCFSCRTEDYEVWKGKHDFVLDDLLCLKELMGDECLSAKKRLGFSFEKIKKYNACRNVIFKQADSSSSSGGNMEIIYISNGLLQFRKNTTNPIIEESVLEMFDLLDYKK